MLSFFQVYPWSRILLQIPTGVVNVYQTAVACLTVTTNHVKPARDMYPVPMVTISTDLVLPIILVPNLLCGMMWRNAVSTRARLVHQTHHHQQLFRLCRQALAPQQQVVILEHLAHVYQTAAACLMVTTNHVKPARDMYPVPMVSISTDPALPIILVPNFLCGMMWRNAVSTRVRLAHHPYHHQQELRLSRQAPAPQQQVVILEHLAHVYRTAGACSMVITNHVKPARDMYPVPMVTISTDPALPIILVPNLLCGMMWRNAVSTRVRLAHQPRHHRQLFHLCHQALAPQQQVVFLEHLAHVYQTAATCPMVTTHHVKPMRDMWPANMVCSVRKPAQLVKCGMMWRNTAWDIKLSVSQTVGTCLMVTTNHVNFAMVLWPASMVFCVSIPVMTIFFGMIGRSDV